VGLARTVDIEVAHSQEPLEPAVWWLPAVVLAERVKVRPGACWSTLPIEVV
jgi:hypothetical protein